MTNTFDGGGRQLTMQDVNGVTSRGYDSADRQTSVRYPTDHALAYTLDAVGNRDVLDDSTTACTTSSHDGQDRCAEIVGVLGAAKESPHSRFRPRRRNRRTPHSGCGEGIAALHIQAVAETLSTAS